MSSLPRLLGFALVLLLAFLAAAAGAQMWLRGQHERLQDVAIDAKRLQVEAALDVLTNPRPAGLDINAAAARISDLVGAEVVVLSADQPLAAPVGPGLAFDLTTSDGERLRVTMPPSPSGRLLLLHQRVVIALLVLALVLLLALVLVLILRPKPNLESHSRPPWVFAKAEMESLHHLARTSVTQGAELARERDERMRAQEEAFNNQVRLNQALEEKIRLGRDLHDGIIQSLYATGLTLENVRDLVERNPTEAVSRLQRSIELLNTSIRDVRNYISGLKPTLGQEAAFSQVVARIADELRAERPVDFDVEIDDSAAARLAEELFSGAVQVMREAISNALRHGGATRIVIRLHEGDGALALLVQDNGAGFDLSTGPRGHGLANMQARAEGAGGSLQVVSTPGNGTRIVLTLPLTSSVP